MPVGNDDLSDPVGVNMGNPHAVFFVDDAEAVLLPVIGPELETHPFFPERANIEVVQLLGPDQLRMRVWERGVGITRACGSGACAAAVAAHRRGLTGRRVEVVLDGGALWIDWREDGHVVMTGARRHQLRRNAGRVAAGLNWAGDRNPLGSSDMGDLDLSNCINKTCPWSGKPVAADSLTSYRGHVVGFCNPGCREKFETATGQFDALLDRSDTGPEAAS